MLYFTLLYGDAFLIHSDENTFKVPLCDKNDLIKSLTEKDIKIGHYAKRGILDESFTINHDESITKLIGITPRELGLQEVTKPLTSIDFQESDKLHTYSLLRNAEAVINKRYPGIKRCRSQDGLFLRSFYLNQPKNQTIYVMSSTPLNTSTQSYTHYFRLANGPEKGLGIYTWWLENDTVLGLDDVLLYRQTVK